MPGTASRFIPLKRAAAYPTTTGIRQLAQVLTEPARCGGRAAGATGRVCDVGEGSEIEIGEGLESLGSGCVAQAVGQPVSHLAICRGEHALIKRNRKFVDSPLEQSGFELLVPLTMLAAKMPARRPPKD